MAKIRLELGSIEATTKSLQNLSGTLTNLSKTQRSLRTISEHLKTSIGTFKEVSNSASTNFSDLNKVLAKTQNNLKAISKNMQAIDSSPALKRYLNQASRNVNALYNKPEVAGARAIPRGENTAFSSQNRPIFNRPSVPPPIVSEARMSERNSSPYATLQSRNPGSYVAGRNSGIGGGDNGFQGSVWGSNNKIHLQEYSPANRGLRPAKFPAPPGSSAPYIYSDTSPIFSVTGTLPPPRVRTALGRTGGIVDKLTGVPTVLSTFNKQWLQTTASEVLFAGSVGLHFANNALESKRQQLKNVLYSSLNSYVPLETQTMLLSNVYRIGNMFPGDIGFRKRAEANLRNEFINRSLNYSFSPEDVAMSARYLAQSGFDKNLVMSSLTPMFQYAEVTGGVTELPYTADMVRNLVNKFKIRGESGISGALSQVYKASQITALDPESMNQFFNTIGSSAVAMNADLSEVLAMGGLLRNMGQPAGQAGQTVSGLYRSLSMLYRKNKEIERKLDPYKHSNDQLNPRVRKFTLPQVEILKYGLDADNFYISEEEEKSGIFKSSKRNKRGELKPLTTVMDELLLKLTYERDKFGNIIVNKDGSLKRNSDANFLRLSQYALGTEQGGMGLLTYKNTLEERGYTLATSGEDKGKWVHTTSGTKTSFKELQRQIEDSQEELTNSLEKIRGTFQNVSSRFSSSISALKATFIKDVMPSLTTGLEFITSKVNSTIGIMKNTPNTSAGLAAGVATAIPLYGVGSAMLNVASSGLMAAAMYKSLVGTSPERIANFNTHTLPKFGKMVGAGIALPFAIGSGYKTWKRSNNEEHPILSGIGATMSGALQLAPFIVGFNKRVGLRWAGTQFAKKFPFMSSNIPQSYTLVETAGATRGAGFFTPFRNRNRTANLSTKEVPLNGFNTWTPGLWLLGANLVFEGVSAHSEYKKNKRLSLLYENTKGFALNAGNTYDYLASDTNFVNSVYKNSSTLGTNLENPYFLSIQLSTLNTEQFMSLFGRKPIGGYNSDGKLAKNIYYRGEVGEFPKLDDAGKPVLDKNGVPVMVKGTVVGREQILNSKAMQRATAKDEYGQSIITIGKDKKTMSYNLKYDSQAQMAAKGSDVNSWIRSEEGKKYIKDHPEFTISEKKKGFTDGWAENSALIGATGIATGLTIATLMGKGLLMGSSSGPLGMIVGATIGFGMGVAGALGWNRVTRQPEYQITRNIPQVDVDNQGLPIRTFSPLTKGALRELMPESLGEKTTSQIMEEATMAQQDIMTNFLNALGQMLSGGGGSKVTINQTFQGADRELVKNSAYQLGDILLKKLNERNRVSLTTPTLLGGKV